MIWKKGVTIRTELLAGTLQGRERDRPTGHGNRLKASNAAKYPFVKKIGLGRPGRFNTITGYSSR